VTSTGPARVLDINAPAGFDEFGFDRFVAAVGQPAKGMTLPEPVVEPDPEQLANLATRFGIDVLGPPGAVPSSLDGRSYDADGGPSARMGASSLLVAMAART
jgi:hypothetical protein